MPPSNRVVFLRLSRSNGLTSRTAVYGPVRTVVWQGAGGDRRPHADHTAKCRGSHLDVESAAVRSLRRAFRKGADKLSKAHRHCGLAYSYPEVRLSLPV